MFRSLFTKATKAGAQFSTKAFQVAQPQLGARATKVARMAGGATVVGSALWMASFAVAAEEETVDYNEVRKSIADILELEDYDDGSLGPIFVRLAWHASGTYSVKDRTGGSNGATMRFSPESAHGANAGLGLARDILEKVKQKYPGISYSDLWTLAGCVAVEEAGGPKVGWQAGRTDKSSGADCTPDGRLPDAAQGAAHLRDIFYRMGMNDQEIVALAGAHCLGRCHTDRSGFSGPWTRAPTTFSNLYFKELTENTWTPKKWSGPDQFEDPTGDLMMLPADVCLLDDPAFRKYVDIYAKDEARFFRDFSQAFQKLEENGVPSQFSPLVAVAAVVGLALAKGA